MEVKDGVLMFDSTEEAVNRLETLKEAIEGEDILNCVEISSLLAVLRPPTKSVVLITTEARIEALRKLFPSILERGGEIRYHGEILDTISVFTNERLPAGVFSVVPREQLATWLQQGRLL